MSIVTVVCSEHGAFLFEVRRVSDRGGVSSTPPGFCPTCGQKAAVIGADYDFTNFVVAKALVAPEWSAEELTATRRDVDRIVESARSGAVPSTLETGIAVLAGHQPILAAALRARIAGRSHDDVLSLVESVLAAVAAMTTAERHGRLTVQLKDAIVYPSLA